MTIAADALGGEALGSQSDAVPTSTSKPPKKRQVAATADAVARPEAR